MDYYDDYLNGPYLYPLPWVGLYIAVASLICSVAMAGDVVHGFRWKVLWFPCKFFTVNAASLTLLAVATKLTVDLTTAMLGRTDRMSKLSSTIFVTIVMGNFLTSFASMDSNAILINIAALGILVITIFVDGIIQIPTSGIDTSVIAEEGFVLLSMLFLFVTLSFSALTVPTTKKHLELKYGELHKIVSNGGTLEETEKLTNQKLKEVVKIYWVMAVTSSPQFVMARSVTSATSGIICLLTVGTLIESMVRIDLVPSDSAPLTSSAYRWSAAMILWIQFIGVLVGSVAPIFRWFTAINLNRRNVLSNWHLNTLILVENYWIQRFVEWKERPLALGNRGMKCKKLIQNVKNLVMNLCIGVQFGIVVVSKVAQFISIIILILPFSACYNYYKRLNENRRSKTKVANENPTSESGGSPTKHIRSGQETLDPELDLSDYVLQLEGEVKLPARILKNICDEVNQVIQMAIHRKPKNLTELLRKSSTNFKGVVDFDSSQVPHCWALPVVTLTSIATALPNIECHRVEQLKRSVSEGLSYIDIVEKSLSSKGDDLLDIKHAVDVTWGRIELYGKWLNEDLKLALTGKTSQEILQTLVDIAEKSAIEFQRSITGSSKVLVANSMRRISQTILKDYESNTDAHTDENLFEQLSIMIADIVGACLTNLPLVIARKCYGSPIEEREKSVRHAASLLGETEEIMEILRSHQLPSLSGDLAAYIDEWRAFMKQKNTPAIVVSSNNETVASGSGELHLDVDVHVTRSFKYRPLRSISAAR